MTIQKDWLEKDFYQTLGVTKSSSAKDITKTYRKLARKFHPDANPGDNKAEERFKEVSAAYDVIGDEKKRSEYDEARRLGSFGGGFNTGVDDFNSGGVPFDISDIFGNFFGNNSGTASHKGRDVEATLKLSFLDAIKGITTSLSLGDLGSREHKSVRVRIPPGVENGQRVRIKGKGQAGNAGPGDLYVIVSVEPHKIFGRKGQDLTISVEVSFPELVLGSELQVKTLDDGIVTLRLPPGTPNGRTFRVKECGVATKKGCGDLLVTVDISIPTELDKDEISLVKKLAKLMEREPKDLKNNDES